MKNLWLISSTALITQTSMFRQPHSTAISEKVGKQQSRERNIFTLHAAKSAGFSKISGTGKNKKNGNIFERWKCFDCQGFGLKSCPVCGKGGLTPEQRGER
ncbi:uncharacterized protein [Primulina eburnea]|uniref:uncharacterized protein isoform X2 n=1 Tax=Primulina eburnea TaxID=1245227 RepID=UPI003C6C0919